MSKFNMIVMGLLVIAIIFVPFIPNDAPINCDASGSDCDDNVGYISAYTKFLK